MSRRYYSSRLSGERLRSCYETAPPRVRQYLEAEVHFVVSRLRPTDTVLELGCGYGRVALRLAEVAARIVGIDTSAESLTLARHLAGAGTRCEFLQMDASALAFRGGAFDRIICVQNGICAFGVDPLQLIRRSLEVIRPGGVALFSTYSRTIWPHRLAWFEAQAAAGLVGEIDRDRTGSGTIVCKDGFRIGTLSPDTFRSLSRSLGVDAVVTTVDESSVFCEIAVPSAAHQGHRAARD